MCIRDRSTGDGRRAPMAASKMSLSLTLFACALAAFAIAATEHTTTTEHASTAADNVDEVVPELVESSSFGPGFRAESPAKLDATLAEWGGKVSRRRRTDLDYTTPAQIREQSYKRVAAWRRRAPIDTHRGHYLDPKSGTWRPFG
eukprot:TRINITY_DN1534_c0_g1_i2.p2 TRINITY_DN1534_c0_g1~~TRINITY_DN1534_c0_g1_i2.p2  ORF type:complete len:145 (-),score=20.70 TRINITY_DN1534_c0_g1_i2:266-700(-)